MVLAEAHSRLPLCDVVSPPTMVPGDIESSLVWSRVAAADEIAEPVPGGSRRVTTGVVRPCRIVARIESAVADSVAHDLDVADDDIRVLTPGGERLDRLTLGTPPKYGIRNVT